MVFCRRMVNTEEERLLGLEEAQGQVSLKTRIWVETKLIGRITLPSMLARVTNFGMYVVTQVFIGHVDELDLAAYALVQSILTRFVNGILVSCLLSILCQPFQYQERKMLNAVIYEKFSCNHIDVS